MKDTPWELFEDMKHTLPENSITPFVWKSPPCGNCKFWQPRFIKASKAHNDGVRLCWSDDMCSDFSCFKERG